MVKRNGLGRNLSALLSPAENISSADTALPERKHLAIHQLQPGKYQPRVDFDEASLMELAQSIQSQGLLQPLVVRKISQERYEIIAGERRWRACQLIGMSDVPVVVRQVNDEAAMAIALIENLQREDLNVMDEARALHRLTTEFALTHQQVAELLCKSRTAVSNSLRLLNLTQDVRRMLECGDLDMGHARCLLMLPESQQSQVAQMVVAKNLTVRETETLVSKVRRGDSLQAAPEGQAEIKPIFKEQLHRLAEQLQTKVKLKVGKKGKGTLVIHYDDERTLGKVMEQLISEAFTS